MYNSKLLQIVDIFSILRGARGKFIWYTIKHTNGPIFIRPGRDIIATTVHRLQLFLA